MMNKNYLIGMTVEDAKDYAQQNGKELVVVQVDDAPYWSIQDVGDTIKIYVAVKKGSVSEIKN